MTAADSLTTAQRFATQSGWAPIPLLPLQKAAALAGYYQTATTDEVALRDQWRRAQFRIDHDTANPERAGMEPGIGIVLGRSGLAVLDADTPEQVAAVHAAFAAWGIELGSPTVRTPGTVDAEGVQQHKDGGHWYFLLPEDITAHPEVLAEAKIVLKVGDGVAQGDLMTGKCYVVTPPTRRPEGEYTKTEGTEVRELPPQLADPLRKKVDDLERRRAWTAERAATAERDAEEWAWFDQTSWETVLPDDYREVGVEPSGCVRYLRDGGSSSHSATAHVAGCPHIVGGDPSRPPVCTFFTAERPDYVVRALTKRDGSAGQSAGKFALYAHKFHGGDWAAARRAARLSSRRRRPTPPMVGSTPTPGAYYASTTTSRSRPAQPRPIPIPVYVPTPVPLVPPRVPQPAPTASKSEVTLIPELSSTATQPVPETDEGRTDESAAIGTDGTDGATPAPIAEVHAPTPAVPADDAFTPEVLPGLPAGFTAPAPFIPRNIAAEVVAAVAAHAAEAGPDLAVWLYAVEGEQGSYMGRDDEPAAWSNRHREMRSRRDHLMSICQATVAALAAAVPGVTPGRIRSTIRVLLPAFRDAGWIVRERPPYDTFVYRGPKKREDVWGCNDLDETDADDDDAETGAVEAPATYPPEATGFLIWRPADAIRNPTFPPLIGHSAVDPDSLPRDVPVLTRRRADDPLVFVPLVGTDPQRAVGAVMASVPDGGICAVDVETTGANWDDTIRTIQFGSATCAVVLDAADPAHTAAAARAIEGHILSGRIWATAHNSAFDALHLHRAGIADGLALLDHCFDTYILQTLIEAPLSDDEKKGGASDKRGLKALTSDWLDLQWSSRAEDAMREYWASRKWRGQQGWARTDVTEPHYLFYAGSDVIDAARLCAVLLGIVRVGMGDEVIRREHLMAADAGRMQLNGYLLDLEALARDEGARQEEVTVLRRALVDLGLENPNSTPQIKRALVAEREAEIDRRVAEAVARAEAEGSDAAAAALRAAANAEKAVPPVLTTDKASLQTMRWSRIAPAVLAYRKVTKTAGTYTSAWPKKADESGRLHPNINPLKASTGRFSASGPNLQNVPKEVRKYLIAGPGKALVTADFSSIEMRVGAAYAGEENLRADYLAGLDPYREVAKLAYDTDDPTKDERDATKPILLGRMYGRGAENLARVAKSRNPDADFDDLVQQAERIMREGIDKRYPRLRQASYELGGLIRAGHTRIEFPDASGRTISLDPSNAHKAFNARVQGAARELLVDAAFRLRRAGLGNNLWLPVHDEWVLEVEEDRAEEVKEILVTEMATTFRDVPVVVEATVLGKHWHKPE